jgi:hypothetical protein
MRKVLLLVLLFFPLLFQTVSAQEIFERMIVDYGEMNLSDSDNVIDNKSVIVSEGGTAYITFRRATADYSYIRKFDIYGNLYWTRQRDPLPSGMQHLNPTIALTHEAAAPFDTYLVYTHTEYSIAGSFWAIYPGEMTIGGQSDAYRGGSFGLSSDTSPPVSVKPLPTQSFIIAAINRNGPGPSNTYSRVQVASDRWASKRTYFDVGNYNVWRQMLLTANKDNIFVIASSTFPGAQETKLVKARVSDGAMLDGYPVNIADSYRLLNKVEVDAQGNFAYLYGNGLLSRVRADDTVAFDPGVMVGDCASDVDFLLKNDGIMVFCLNNSNDILLYKISLDDGSIINGPFTIGTKNGYIGVGSASDFFSVVHAQSTGALVAWSDTDYAVHVTKVSEALSLDDLIVSGGSPGITKIRPLVIEEPTSPLGFLVVWEDDRSGDRDIYMAGVAMEEEAQEDCDVFTKSMDICIRYAVVASPAGWRIIGVDSAFWSPGDSLAFGDEPSHLARLNESDAEADYALIGHEDSWTLYKLQMADPVVEELFTKNGFILAGDVYFGATTGVVVGGPNGWAVYNSTGTELASGSMPTYAAKWLDSLEFMVGGPNGWEIRRSDTGELIDSGIETIYDIDSYRYASAPFYYRYAWGGPDGWYVADTNPLYAGCSGPDYVTSIGARNPGYVALGTQSGVKTVLMSDCSETELTNERVNQLDFEDVGVYSDYLGYESFSGLGPVLRYGDLPTTDVAVGKPSAIYSPRVIGGGEWGFQIDNAAMPGITMVGGGLPIGQCIVALEGPIADAGGPYSGDVEELITLHGSGTDNDGVIESIEWETEVGDCTLTQGSPVGLGTPNATRSATISCPAPVSRYVFLTVVDDDSLYDDASAQLTVGTQPGAKSLEVVDLAAEPLVVRPSEPGAVTVTATVRNISGNIVDSVEARVDVEGVLYFPAESCESLQHNRTCDFTFSLDAPPALGNHWVVFEAWIPGSDPPVLVSNRSIFNVKGEIGRITVPEFSPLLVLLILAGLLMVLKRK